MTTGEVIALIKAFGGGSGGGGSSGGGALVVNLTWNGDSADLDKTWQEIFDAANAGVPVVVKESSGDTIYYNYLLLSVYSQQEGSYQVDILNVIAGDAPMLYQFATNTATGYPHMA